MSAVVNSGSTAMTSTSSAPSGTLPTPGQRSASQPLRQGASPVPTMAKRNTGSPSNDGNLPQQQQQQKRQPKAWGSHAPQQQGSGMGPTYSKANSSNSGSPVNEAESADRQMYDRLLYLLIRSIGSNVVATVRSGARYSGVLSSAQTQGDVGVVLRFARQVSPPPGGELEDGAKNAVISTFLIQPKDLLDIKILEVNLNDRNGFRTDADISKAFTPESRERELQPWKPDTDGPLSESLDDLASSTATAGNTWDQFAANERLFGVQTTFDETTYTTKLDKSHPQYKERLAVAERIAREIEGSSHGGNVHLAEERGIVVDDSGIDEEDKYSGVVRDKATLAGLQSSGSGGSKYTPPSLRQKTPQQPAQQPAQQPGSRVQIPQRQQPNVAQTPASQIDSAILSSKVIDASATKSPSSAEPSSAVTSATSATSASSIAASEGAKSVLADIKAAVKDKQSSASPDSDKKNQVIGTFKQFVHGEKERLNAKKREISKKEIEGKLSELMEFSQRFKLHTPVPMDLVPILAKDKAKQEEIIQKSAVNAQHADGKRPLSSSAIAGSVQPSPSPKPASPGPTLTAKLLNNLKKPESPSPVSSPPPPTTTASPSGPAKKLNVNALEFKPNPFAASFTPSFGPRAPSSPAVKAATTPAPSSTAMTTPSASSPTPPLSMGTPRTVSKNISRAESPSFFGPTWKPPSEARPSINDAFNPFLRAKEEHKGDGPVVIIKAYTFPPIWPYSDNPGHAELFTAPEPVSLQRIYGIPPIPTTPLPFSPRVVQPIPSGQISPRVNGSASPFHPSIHPPYDDSIRQMVPGASPPVASPNMAPPQMMQPPVPFSPNIMYAQHTYPPPGYFAGRPPTNMPQGFMGGPPHQFMQHQPFPNYMPSQQMSPPQGYSSPGRNNQATMIMPSNGPQGGYNGGFYGQPQMHMMRGPPPMPVSQAGGPPAMGPPQGAVPPHPAGGVHLPYNNNNYPEQQQGAQASSQIPTDQAAME